MEKLRETSGLYSSLIRKIHHITSIHIRQFTKRNLKQLQNMHRPKEKPNSRKKDNALSMTRITAAHSWSPYLEPSLAEGGERPVSRPPQILRGQPQKESLHPNQGTKP
jgi:hypothetical protein